MELSAGGVFCLQFITLSPSVCGGVQDFSVSSKLLSAVLNSLNFILSSSSRWETMAEKVLCPQEDLSAPLLSKDYH